MSAQRRRNKQLDLVGRVAVVTGANRGARRAIAAVLGEHGATVYVSGRSVRGQPTTDNLPAQSRTRLRKSRGAAGPVLRRGATTPRSAPWKRSSREFAKSQGGWMSSLIMPGEVTKVHVLCRRTS